MPSIQTSINDEGMSAYKQSIGELSEYKVKQKPTAY